MENHCIIDALNFAVNERAYNPANTTAAASGTPPN